MIFRLSSGIFHFFTGLRKIEHRAVKAFIRRRSERRPPLAESKCHIITNKPRRTYDSLCFCRSSRAPGKEQSHKVTALSRNDAAGGRERNENYCIIFDTDCSTLSTAFCTVLRTGDCGGSISAIAPPAATPMPSVRRNVFTFNPFCLLSGCFEKLRCAGSDKPDAQGEAANQKARAGTRLSAVPHFILPARAKNIGFQQIRSLRQREVMI